MKKAARLARRLDEASARELGARVAAEARLRPDRAEDAFDERLRFGAAPCGRERRRSERGLELIRVGPLFFVDEALRRRLSPALLERLGANAIWLRDLKDGTIAGSIGDFTMVAVVALLHAELGGRHLIDAGAAEGTLALAAARLGAASLELVELDAAALARAKTNLELNGLSERADFRLVEADLSDPATVVKSLRPGASPAVLVCNLGYWDYTATNAEGILLLDLVPKAELFVGGGYSSAGLGGLAHLRDDVELLGAIGFRAGTDMAATKTRSWRSWTGTETMCAFLAARDGSARPDHAELVRRVQERKRSGVSRRHALARSALPLINLAIGLLLAGALYFLYRAFQSARRG
jgi:hypothetical protein